MRILYELVTVYGECPDKMSLSERMGRLQGVMIQSRETCLFVCTGYFQPNAASNRQYVQEGVGRTVFENRRLMPKFAVRFLLAQEPFFCCPEMIQYPKGIKQEEKR